MAGYFLENSVIILVRRPPLQRRVQLFKRMFETSSAQGPFRASSEERPAKDLSSLSNGDRVGNEPPPNINVTAKLASFEELYLKSDLKSAAPAGEWNVLKVAEMLNSEHLRGLSPASKHSALLMALEAAGVAVEDVLQDAVQRQRVLNDYEDGQQQRLLEIESAKLRENERLAAEMEAVSSQYRARIAAGAQEIECERERFREWQEQKEREQRRIAEAASACVSDDSSTSSEASITRLLEKNAGVTRYRESA